MINLHIVTVATESKFYFEWLKILREHDILDVANVFRKACTRRLRQLRQSCLSDPSNPGVDSLV